MNAFATNYAREGAVVAHESADGSIEIGRDDARESHPNRIVPLVVTQRVNAEQPHPVAVTPPARPRTSRAPRRRERIG